MGMTDTLYRDFLTGGIDGNGQFDSGNTTVNNLVNLPGNTITNQVSQAISPSNYGNTATTGVAGISSAFSNFLASPTSANASSLFDSGAGAIGGGLLGGLGNAGATIAPYLPNSTQPAAMSSWSDFFLRGTVIILGFIFVAVGLSMFRSSNNTVAVGLNNIGKHTGKVLGAVKDTVI